MDDCEWRIKQMKKNITADGLVLELYARRNWKLRVYLVSVLLTVNVSWNILSLQVDKPLSPALELSCRMFSQHRQSKWPRAAAAEPPAKTRQCSSNAGQTVQQHKQLSALSLTNNHLSARGETTLTNQHCPQNTWYHISEVSVCFNIIWLKTMCPVHYWLTHAPINYVPSNFHCLLIKT